MGWKKIETLNSVNRLKKEAFTYMSLKLIAFSWQPHPSPQLFPKFLPSGLGDQGKPRWRLRWRLMISPTNFKWKHGFCQDAAWSFNSVTSYFLDHLNVIKRRYLILNKKAHVGLALVTKHWSCTCMESFDHSTGKIWRFKLTVWF